MSPASPAVYFPVGKYLYHGTSALGNSFIPNRQGGNWFSTQAKQSILHSISTRVTQVAVLYMYKVVKPIKIKKINSEAEFNKWALKNFDIKPENGFRTLAFSGNNKQVAEALCATGTYDGWWFPKDQSQVMICNPKKFLQLVKIKYIIVRGSPGITFNKNIGKYLKENPKQPEQVKHRVTKSSTWQWKLSTKKPPSTTRRIVKARRPSTQQISSQLSALKF